MSVVIDTSKLLVVIVNEVFHLTSLFFTSKHSIMLVIRGIFLNFLLISCTFADHSKYKHQWHEFKVKLMNKKYATVSVIVTVTPFFLFVQQKMYNKHYHTLAEEKQRFSAFVDNQKKIFKHNYRHSLGEVTYTLKSNEFADLTHKEFLSKYVGNRIVLDKRCI